MTRGVTAQVSRFWFSNCFLGSHLVILESGVGPSGSPRAVSALYVIPSTAVYLFLHSSFLWLYTNFFCFRKVSLVDSN